MINVFTFPQVCLPAALAGSGCWNSGRQLLCWGGSGKGLGVPGPGRDVLWESCLTPASSTACGKRALLGMGKLACWLWVIHSSRETLSLCRVGAPPSALELGRALCAPQLPGLNSELKGFCLSFKLYNVLCLGKISMWPFVSTLCH